MTRLTRLFLRTALLIGALALPAMAQQNTNPYAPRVIVNDRAITNYEVGQRIALMRVLGTPGDLNEEALNALIDDRLRLSAADELGIEVSPEDLQAGVEEFAARGNLTPEQLLRFLSANGVAPEALYDFVGAGLAWRQVVRVRFGPRAQITEDEIDRAVALSGQRGGARVLLSEILLRADTPAYRARSEALAAQLSRQIKTPEAFAAAARRHSVSGSRGRGGRIDWLELSNLPPQLATIVLSLGPGEVSEPIPIPNAVALFQLRAIEEQDAPQAEDLAIEYAQFFLPGGDEADARKVRGQVDRCDDMYGVAHGLPEERLRRETLPVIDIAPDIAFELAKLDTGETATLRQGKTLSIVMLCGRTTKVSDGIDRGAMLTRLRNQRMGSYADGYLAELRADAIIRKR